MNDYRRFVSYMYNYEEKIKKNNVGFARVETKENQCKITIHIQVKTISSGSIQLYGVYRKEIDFVAVPLGTIGVKNGKGDGQIITQVSNIGASEVPFDKIGGLILYLSDDKYFGTEWDDKPLVFKEFRLLEKEDFNNSEVKTAEIQSEGKEVIVQKKETEPVVSQTETLQRVASQNVASKNADFRRVNFKNATPQRVVPQNIAFQNVESQKVVSQKEEVKKEEVEEVEEVLEKTCVKEEPKKNRRVFCEMDSFFEPYSISELLEKFSYTVTDDFMLHGYCRFGHLGVMKKDNTYILGVPGVFCKREEIIANCAGFHNFYNKNKRPLKYGDFGYWYTNMEYLK